MAREQGDITLCALSHGHYPGKKLKKREFPGLCSVGVMDAPEDQAWGMDIHRNEGLEICFVEYGRLSFRVDGKRFVLKPGDLTLTRPWQAHRHGDPHFEACRLLYVIIDVGARRPHEDWTWPEWLVLTSEDLRELSARLRGSQACHWSASSDVTHGFHHLGEALHEPEAFSLSELAVQLNVLLLSLLQQLRNLPAGEKRDLTAPTATVRLFLEDLRINTTVRNRDWTLDEMASECAMGVTRFCALTRRLHNRSPLKLLRGWRLHAAAEELRQDPGVSITDVAYRNGFNSSQYFATCFRRQFGCSPRAHRGHPGES